MSTKLEDAAAARKKKLLALRNRKAQVEAGTAPQEVFVFRNYDPETGAARIHSKQDEAATVEEDVKGLAEKILLEDRERRAQELDLSSIQPKRPNWDLKRDLEKRLTKLDRQTESSINRLIRERLAKEKDQDESYKDATYGATLANAIESRNLAQDEDDEDASAESE